MLSFWPIYIGREGKVQRTTLEITARFGEIALEIYRRMKVLLLLLLHQKTTQISTSFRAPTFPELLYIYMYVCIDKLFCAEMSMIESAPSYSSAMQNLRLCNSSSTIIVISVLLSSVEESLRAFES